MNARLYCKTGVLAGSEYRIDEKATIGRNEQNDITLPPDAVSGRHARIFFDDEEDCYVLEDLDSSNGTRLDDAEVIDPVPLKKLHIITFAESVDFIFQAVEKTAASSTEEKVKTQFGVAPEPPSNLPGEGEADGDRTRIGGTPGALPNPSEEGESDESGGERTQMGQAPGELPDLSDEDASEKEEGSSTGVDRTRFGEAPPELPDLFEEDAASEEEESSSKEDNRTRFGESPPELPNRSAGPSGEERGDDKEQTQMGGAAPSLPDFSGGGSSSEKEDEDTVEEEPSSSEAPTQAVPNQEHPAAEPSPQYALDVFVESGSQDTHPLSRGVVTIGRSPECDIQVEDPGVSRQHARLVVESGEVVIEDMGSKNFTFIDGHRLSGPTALSPGSEIQFGLQAKAVLRRAPS